VHVVVNASLCQAYGNCLLAAPDVFDLDEERNVAFVLQSKLSPDTRPAVEEAVRSCPVLALTLHE
jgi:ferredoxin